MLASVLGLVACPVCTGSLRLAAGAYGGDGHLLEGALCCDSCSARYAVAGGVPRLVTRELGGGSASTARRFGAQWKTFSHMADYQEQKLSEWLLPIGPEHFRGKLVYEAGCGKGRHSVVAAAWGAKALLALDLSEAVDVAFQHTRALPNVHVVQGDLLNPPVRRVFELAFSVGVLHHLPVPREGFAAVAGALVPGGTLAVWVYGYESNEWVVRYVDPVRKQVTSKMPKDLLYWATLPPALTLSAVSKLYRFHSLATRLPKAGYMRWLGELPLREVHNIVFDQLTPPIAHYLPQREVESWFGSGAFSEVRITPFRENSWRASARVGGVQERRDPSLSTGVH